MSGVQQKAKHLQEVVEDVAVPETEAWGATRCEIQTVATRLKRRD